MYLLFTIILVFSLLLIIYQDMKDRLVSLWLFGILFFTICLKRAIAQQQSLMLIGRDIIINTSFITLLLGLCVAYFKSIKKNTSFFDTMIGWGDIALWVAIAPSAHLFLYVLLLLASMIFSLLLYIIRRSYTIRKGIVDVQIPLAGYQAVFFLFFFVADYFFPVTDFIHLNNMYLSWNQ